MRVALYVRCSTSKQETDNQLSQLRQWADSQKWEVVKVYEDMASGKTAGREQFQALFTGAERRRFECAAFWSLDRFGREGPLATLLHLQRLTAAGCQFKSYSEPYLDSTTPVGQLLIPILSWIAAQERQRISDRTRAGLETARRKGKRLGRPVGTRLDVATIARLRGQGLSTRAIAAAIGKSKSAVQLIVSDLQSVKPM